MSKQTKYQQLYEMLQHPKKSLGITGNSREVRMLRELMVTGFTQTVVAVPINNKYQLLDYTDVVTDVLDILGIEYRKGNNSKYSSEEPWHVGGNYVEVTSPDFLDVADSIKNQFKERGFDVCKIYASKSTIDGLPITIAEVYDKDGGSWIVAATIGKSGELGEVWDTWTFDGLYGTHTDTEFIDYSVRDLKCHINHEKIN